MELGPNVSLLDCIRTKASNHHPASLTILHLLCDLSTYLLMSELTFLPLLVVMDSSPDNAELIINSIERIHR